MEKYDEKSLTLNNDTFFVSNDITSDTKKCDLISFESNDANNKNKAKKSQLLTSDGWKTYQKELIRSCFEFWEVNETQLQANNSCPQSNLVNDRELLTPSSLFANGNNNHKIGNGFQSNSTLNNAIISDELENKECVDVDERSKYQNNQVVKQISTALNNNTERETNENCSKTADNMENKRTTKKKLKNFCFYKQLTKQIKLNQKSQSFTFNRHNSCSSENVWKYKIWLDSVEKIKEHHKLNIDLTEDNTIENFNNVNRDDNTIMYSLDIEGKQIEQKVRKLIKSFKEKDKLFATIGINEQTTELESSNKFKYFFKNAFRGNQNELDRQLLDAYAKYINRELYTWQTLSYCLNDIRLRERPHKINTARPFEETIKYRFSELRERRNEKATDDYDNSKFADITNGFNTMGKQKINKFFKLLNKTKSNMDVRTAVGRTERNNCVDSIRVNQWTSNKNDGGNVDFCKLLDGLESQKPPRQIRKSLSDTDLSVTTNDVDYDRRSFGKKTTRIGEKTPDYFVAGDDENHYNRHWDGLCEEQQECFQTVAARLEYVGSTFKEQCRQAGLKTLCKVDVLAGMGHTAEAVDLFVSTLPLSKNPGMMIQRAETAYDWKFFCHLSIWRHSYKD